eukprot:TRINITY_DN39813_c0_g1_i1.p1 TRINITY_DN39813_c0_g1~~TRINITY_DN39813_c0_g1_i1.p1  ORF type:complete len:252 (+),score=44.30 TRINITY_DN39813_c0_g1_i1:99-854(+)
MAMAAASPTAALPLALSAARGRLSSSLRSTGSSSFKAQHAAGELVLRRPPSRGAVAGLPESVLGGASRVPRESRALDFSATEVPDASVATQRGVAAACLSPAAKKASTLGRRGNAGSGMNPADMQAYESLLTKQQERLPGILRELEKHERKTSCWAWWVFPTDMEGNCDPARTRVTPETAALLCANSTTALLWQAVLEKLCDLVEQKGMNVLPRIDHGRVHFFIRFWSKLPASPSWLASVCNRLGKFKWPK